MNDQTTTPVPPVILTPRPDEGRLEGSNGRYEKRLADLVGVYRDPRRTVPCSTPTTGHPCTGWRAAPPRTVRVG